MLQVYIVFGVLSKNDVCKLNFTCSTWYISRHTGYRYRVSQARIIGWGIRFKLQMLCLQENEY